MEDHESTDVEVCVEKVYMHPKFHKPDPSLGHDIALVKLAWAPELNERVQTICEANDYELTADSLCVVSGWGKMNPYMDEEGTFTVETQPNLQQARLSVSSSIDDCPYHTNQTFCGGAASSTNSQCAGDIGGPVQCWNGANWVLAGITSFSLGNDGTISCGAYEFPTMFTNVKYFSEWIQGAIDRHNGQSPEYGHANVVKYFLKKILRKCFNFFKIFVVVRMV